MTIVMALQCKHQNNICKYINKVLLCMSLETGIKMQNSITHNMQQGPSSYQGSLKSLIKGEDPVLYI